MMSWGHYGHLGVYPAELVLKRILDINLVPNADSPYDYARLYRGAL